MSKFWVCKNCGNHIGSDYDRCPACSKPKRYGYSELGQDKFSDEIANDRIQFIHKASENVARSRDPRRRQAPGMHIERGAMRRPKREYDR